MRAGRHGPRRKLLADLDTAIGFGIHDPATPPSRGAFGEFEVTCAVPALARGTVLVGDVAAGAGAAVAVPSVYVSHLAGCLRRLLDATTAGDVRRLPWPFSALTAAVDAAVRRGEEGWEPLGRLEDDHALWDGWADVLVAREGFRVAAPWVRGAGPLGYGRWLPADLVEHPAVRDDGVRALALDADRLVAALTWHGVHAQRADDRLARVLVGWSARLPGRTLSDQVARPTEVVVLPETVHPRATDRDRTLGTDRDPGGGPDRAAAGGPDGGPGEGRVHGPVRRRDPGREAAERA